MQINRFLTCGGGFPAAILLIAIFATLSLAAPFIVADPQADAQRFRLRLSADNGQTWSSWTEADPVNSGLYFDIGGIAIGNYRGEAQAGGNVELIDSATGKKSVVWRWSESAPFELNVRTGTKPGNIRITD